MPAQRTPAETIPLELKRQGERIDEQLTQLQKILGNTGGENGYLAEMVSIMSGYGDDIVTEINKLKAAIQSYSTKSNSIYSDISSNLIRYANNLINNIGELRQSVGNITQSVEAL